MSQTVFSTVVILFGALSVSCLAVVYFQRIRLERPAIGVFNMRDVAIIMFFIVSLPLLYVILPPVVLTGFLVLTFVCALYIGLRPFVRDRILWPLIVTLITLNIIIAHTLLGTQIGWQVYWLLTSFMVLIAAVGVANLYVQGGMRMRHVAWFALALGVYDGVFAFVFPLTQKLADRFEGLPLDPSIGFKMGPLAANIGLGDLLIYGLFTVAAYKAYGRTGASAALGVITVFGAILPTLAPLMIAAVVRHNIGIVVPAQIFFGLPAFITYQLFARRAPERNMAEWYKVQDAQNHTTVRVARPVRRPAPAGQIG